MATKTATREKVLSSLRQGLEQKRRDIVAVLAGDEKELADMTREDSGWSDSAAAAGQQEQVVVEAASLRQELAVIERVLARAKEGVYGICTDCGRPISLDRLKAVPMALRDAPCQKDHEKRAR